MKEEAIELRGSTQETLAKEEIEEMSSSKKRDIVIKEYRYELTGASNSIFNFVSHSLFFHNSSSFY